MQHRPLCNLISWQIRNSNLSCGAKTVQFASLSFDVSFQEIFSTLCSGGTLMVVPGELRRDPAALLQYLEKELIERLFLPFVALHQLADVADCHNSFPDNLREVITAGEQLQITPSIIRMFERLENCSLYNQYGPTESHVVTVFQLPGAPDEWPFLPSIGRPIANSKIYILDSHHQPVPAGIAGELYIGGDCLAREYIHQPEMTSEKFIPNPFCQEPGGRLYKTGDLARYMPDGNIEYLGRLDNQVKVRGFRIEPGEIEAILGKHDSVREAVVAARPDTAGNNRLIAYVVLNGKTDGVNKKLRGYLMKRLPDHMIPSVFVVLDSLPLTPSGKVDRKALPEPGFARSDSGKQCVPPRNDLENKLAKIWENLLEIKPVGMTDNFFDLGGHSLLAVRLLNEIKRRTGNNLTLTAFFHAPTIEQVADIIVNEGLPSPASSLVPIQPRGYKVPLVWLNDTSLVNNLEKDRPLYVLKRPYQELLLSKYSSIEKIAAQYIKDLRALRPEGPYILGGYCFWAVVALEMAVQLKRQGYEVPLLFLLDPTSSCLPLSNSGDITLKQDRILNSRVLHHVRIFSKLNYTEKALYLIQKLPILYKWPAAKLRIQVNNIISIFKTAVCKIYLIIDQPVPETFIRRYYYNIHYRGVIKGYISPIYQGRVILFNSEKGYYGVEPDWSSIAEGKVSVHVVPGAHHIEMLREWNVKVWSKWLNKYLRKVHVNSSGTEV